MGFERETEEVPDTVFGNLSAKRLHFWRGLCHSAAHASKVCGGSGLDRGAGNAGPDGHSAVLSRSDSGERRDTGRLPLCGNCRRAGDRVWNGAAAAHHHFGHLLFLRRLPRQPDSQSLHAGNAGGRGRGDLRRRRHDVRGSVKGAQRAAHRRPAGGFCRRALSGHQHHLRHTRLRAPGTWRGYARARLERRRA